MGVISTMDATLTAQFCAACRLVLGGDTPDVVLAALKTSEGDRIRKIYLDILEGRCPVRLPLDPPAGTLRPQGEHA